MSDSEVEYLDDSNDFEPLSPDGKKEASAAFPATKSEPQSEGKREAPAARAPTPPASTVAPEAAPAAASVSAPKSVQEERAASTVEGKSEGKQREPEVVVLRSLKGLGLVKAGSIGASVAKENGLSKSAEFNRPATAGGAGVPVALTSACLQAMGGLDSVRKMVEKAKGKPKVVDTAHIMDLSQPKLARPSLGVKTYSADAWIRQNADCTCSKKEGCTPAAPRPGCARAKLVYASAADAKNCSFRPTLTKRETDEHHDDGTDVLTRMAAAERERRRTQLFKQQEKEYNAKVDKKVCPKCGTAQSFAEWKDGKNKCQKEACKRERFRQKKQWKDVGTGFLTRLEDPETSLHAKAKAEAQAALAAKRAEPKLAGWR